MDLKKKYIILKISNEGIHYNEIEKVSWNNTNFPSQKFFTFNPNKTIYWEVEMLNYLKETQDLLVKVIDYMSLNANNSLSEQKPKSPIKKIFFQDLQWVHLEKDLSIYNKGAFKNIALFESNLKPTKESFSIVESSLPTNQIIELDTTFPLMKTTFKLGCIEFTKKVKGIIDPVKILLYNDYIIPEFDHVKPYFNKIFGKKSIDIKGTIVLKLDETYEVNIFSKAIASINEDFISSVKRLSLRKAIFDPKVILVDKSLFSPEEYFENTNDQLGNTLMQNNTDILDDILDLGKIRNRKELVYLSGKLQSKKSKLKFTLSPKFGFLFHSQGEEMDHFIWELLDSHATYIWSMDKNSMSLELKYKLLEHEINYIRDNGRKSYLSNRFKSEFIFSKVKHSTSKLVNGFSKWLSQLNEKLI